MESVEEFRGSQLVKVFINQGSIEVLSVDDFIAEKATRQLPVYRGSLDQGVEVIKHERHYCIPH